MTSLKGADKGHVATFQGACEDCGFELLLCTVEKWVMGMADDNGYDYGRRRGYRHRYDSSSEESDESPANFHGLIEVYEADFKLTNFSNKDGEVLIHKLDIDQSLFIDDDVFMGDPDKEDCEGHMGNAAASATHYYRKAAVLIVPKIFRIP
ncbi:hypothetical protein BJX65DRAFT_26710 [Aspergillus insuetus]